MPGYSSNASGQDQMQDDLPGAGMMAWNSKFSRTRVKKPCAIGLIALAIAVALWGFGYKISLYRPYLSPVSRASVAKLWVERRGPSTTPGIHLAPRLRTTADSQTPLLFACLKLTRTESFELFTCSSDARVSSDIAFLLPARSPPAKPSLS